MANFLSSNPANPHCDACQALLTDALDGNLGEIDQTWFDGHIRTCAECAHLFADAQRGAAWLDLLKSTPPEPSADLIARILSQTSAAQTGSQTQLQSPSTQHPSARPAPAFPVPAPASHASTFSAPVRVLPRRSGWAQLPPALFEPRLAMTAAMALFSLALTMNLTGVQLGQLRPSNLRRTYYQSAAGATRYYDNLRVVRVLESRVDDLREENSESNPGAPSRTASPTTRPAPARPQPSTTRKSPHSDGVSRRELPAANPADPKTLYAMRDFRNTGGLV